MICQDHHADIFLDAFESSVNEIKWKLWSNMMCPTAGMLHMSQTYTIVYSNKVHNTVKIYHVLKSEEEE